MTFENVTEMVHARRALQESEGRFRSAFHAASVGMALTTLEGNYVQVNDRLAQMLGYEPSELSTLNVRDVTQPTTSPSTCSRSRSSGRRARLVSAPEALRA